MRRARVAARLILPAVWLGMIIGISLIEAPLKFMAPGITIPLGLGIGRLVFTAMNIVELVIAALLVLCCVRAGVDRRFWGLLWATVAVLLVKVAVIRPILNHETDRVLAGLSAGGSAIHLFYIAADGVLIVLLVLLLAAGARRWLAVPPTPHRVDGRGAAGC
ncbi:hypothetical protein LVY72_04450 [Arthrobacter sp. I2-34]|uniref:Uncharacterized protein n=1 Tax=Arthrobacter hankyongi TaxID=2904801 RepID=A0ABS9L390_9MICC|nr:hypothetical protein [Arthrobacter hankyongi]MCG2621162.1 hypothetical protein [Arthrobacter hankyongi]